MQEGFSFFRNFPHLTKQRFFEFLEECAREVHCEKNIANHISSWNFWRHFWNLPYVSTGDPELQYVQILKKYTTTEPFKKDGIPINVLQQLFVYLQEFNKQMFKHLVFLLWDPMRPSEYAGLLKSDVEIRDLGFDDYLTVTITNRHQKTSMGNKTTSCTIGGNCPGFNIVAHLQQMKVQSCNRYLHGIFDTCDQVLRTLADMWNRAWKDFTVWVYNTKGWLVGHLYVTLYSIRITYFGLNKILQISTDDMKTRVGHSDRSTVYKSCEFQALSTPGFNQAFDHKMASLFPEYNDSSKDKKLPYVHPVKRKLRDRSLVYERVKLKPLNFSKIRGDDWLLHTEFEIKQLNKPPRKKPPRPFRRRRPPRPFHQSLPPPEESSHFFNPGKRTNLFAREKEKIRLRLQRLQLVTKARPQKKELAKFHAEQEEIRQQRLKHQQLVESIEHPTPTVATTKLPRVTQFPHDMQDFGSSAEDSQVSQSEPELQGGELATTHVTPAVCSTDEDEKFCQLQELEIPDTPKEAVPSVPKTTKKDWDDMFDGGFLG